MKNKEIKVSSIILAIGRREMSLTLDEAKELHKALEALFPSEKHTHHYDWNWRPYWYTTCSSASLPVKGDLLPSVFCGVKTNDKNLNSEISTKLKEYLKISEEKGNGTIK